MPEGRTVNDYSTEEWHQMFAQVDDAAALVYGGLFYGKNRYPVSVSPCPHFET